MDDSFLTFNADLKISERQLTVLQLIADGLTNEQIGNKLFLSRRTIEGVRSDLLNLSGSVNSASLVAFGFRNGLIK